MFFLVILGSSMMVWAQDNVFKAIEEGKLDVVKSLVEKDPKLLVGKDRKGYDIATPLHAAARYGQKAIIEYLLTKKIDINAKDQDGWAPAHLAAYGGFRNTLDFLLQNGADIEATCPAGTLLHVGGMAGHAEIVEYLLDKGLQVNLKFGDQGWTPLHSAAYGGFLTPVKLLVAKNADVRARANSGHLPFDIANQNGHAEVAAFLSQMGGAGDD